MLSENERLSYLFRQYADDLALPEEIEELFGWIQMATEDDLLKRQVLEIYHSSRSDRDLPAEKWNKMFDEIINAGMEVSPPVRKISILRKVAIRWAAAAVLIFSTGIYLWKQYVKEKPYQTSEAGNIYDRKPGTIGAILTLSNGSEVLVDSIPVGAVTKEDGSEVIAGKGYLAYKAGESTGGELIYNTMTTPKGRQFQIILPDGSRAWLNAASSITFPASFKGKEREVMIKGEVYFEVAANPKQPFRVKVNDIAIIEVLGTGFNVNAYADENYIKSTLLEGGIKLLSGDKEVTLKPGQQALLDKTITVLNDIDTKQVMAWKNGMFNLNNLTVSELMRQISRWYDVEVIYSSGIPDIELYGKIGRDLNLSQVLKGLEKMGVHSRLEGKTLIVM